MEEIQDCTLQAKSYITESDEIQLGYIIPGHVFKGKRYTL